MAENKNENVTPEEEIETPETAETPEEAVEAKPVETDWEKKFNAEHDSHLRLAAEYDNFRKRTVKEKEMSYSNGKADAILKLLPVYDNLERALNQQTQDAAYKKGVELTMNELLKILGAMGVEVFGQRGEEFDPNLHNAVMQVEDPELTENQIACVFQKGFKMGEKVVRFAMVQVAT